MNVIESLNRLLNLLEKFNHPIVNLLSPGLTREGVIQKLNFLDRDIPEIIIDLFEWRQGVNYSDEKRPYMVNNLWPMGTFYSLDDCISSYKSRLGANVDPKYFPIFSNIGGDYWCLNMDDGYNSFVYLFAPQLTLSSEPMSQYDSLEKFVESVIAALNEGIYSYDDGEWIISDNYFQFFKELNPNSDYWDRSKRENDEDDFDEFDPEDLSDDDY
ncbi:SMI1/KNR4 family protein [Filimonas effusa]|uniref:SMI1/KNR4 family protein n=1 Tax=Filimonas effusa TaxID=2508721 RepID=A0A4Q1D0A3_9BACT|nr:hypothetical protein [Filimonas effusa]RXK81163.1 hypothetical protein ESB13_19675 [Filimonas effusa]